MSGKMTRENVNGVQFGTLGRYRSKHVITNETGAELVAFGSKISRAEA